MKKPIICIDAGHGGKDPGAVGPNGLRESEVALAVAMLLGAQLAETCEVIYTRRDDTFRELGARAMVANDARADALISIHCNSGPPGQGEGFEVFSTRGLTPSDALATDLFSAFAAEFPDRRARMDLGDGDSDKEAGFAVLTRCHGKAALFELEFIHTVVGENWLGDKSNQMRCAKALAVGVRQHFKLTGNAISPGKQGEEIPVKDLILAKLGELQTLVSKL